MPLDGHAYLVAQGWDGMGSGLRQGSISRPVTVAQKKTLSGIGKDRDEAFPFWDHVFEAASINIQVKLHSDSDDDSESTSTSTPAVSLQRTSTGILSNRRPKIGTPAFSGSATPESSDSITPRFGVMAAAKQEAARRSLYSKFFRGPVVGIDDIATAVEAEVDQMVIVTSAVEVLKGVESDEVAVERQRKIKGKTKATDEAADELATEGKRTKRKRKTEAVDELMQDAPQRKEKAKEDAGYKRDKKRRKQHAEEKSSQEEPVGETVGGKIDHAKEEERRRKEEKRARKEGEKARKEEKRVRREEKRMKKTIREPKLDHDTEEATTTVCDHPETSTRNVDSSQRRIRIRKGVEISRSGVADKAKKRRRTSSEIP